MHRHRPSHPSSPQQPKVWLASADGVRLDAQEAIGPIDEPETVLEVEFVGLTPDEQRAALKNFPGGRRFRLRQPASATAMDATRN